MLSYDIDCGVLFTAHKIFLVEKCTQFSNPWLQNTVFLRAFGAQKKMHFLYNTGNIISRNPPHTIIINIKNKIKTLACQNPTEWRHMLSKASPSLRNNIYILRLYMEKQAVRNEKMMYVTKKWCAWRKLFTKLSRMILGRIYIVNLCWDLCKSNGFLLRQV